MEAKYLLLICLKRVMKHTVQKMCSYWNQILAAANSVQERKSYWLQCLVEIGWRSNSYIFGVPEQLFSDRGTNFWRRMYANIECSWILTDKVKMLLQTIPNAAELLRDLIKHSRWYDKSAQQSSAWNETNFLL